MEGKEVKARMLKKGFWKPEEDFILRKYVETHGEGNWTVVSKKSGLTRGAKSCRLRWKNYLRPNIKRGMMSEDEKDLIIRLHKLLGNRWALIAGRLPGRTDNEVKNYWNTHLNKKPTTGHLASKAHHQEPGSSQNRGPTTPVTTNDMADSDWLEDFKLNCDYGIVDLPPLDYETTAFMPILDSLLLFGCDETVIQDSIFL